MHELIAFILWHLWKIIDGRSRICERCHYPYPVQHEQFQQQCYLEVFFCQPWLWLRQCPHSVCQKVSFIKKHILVCVCNHQENLYTNLNSLKLTLTPFDWLVSKTQSLHFKLSTHILNNQCCLQIMSFKNIASITISATWLSTKTAC